MKAHIDSTRPGGIKALWGGFAVAVSLLLSACSAQAPIEIRYAPEQAATVAEVRRQAENYHSAAVRWGGTILNTENRDKTSWVTILALPLDKNGRPDPSDSSPGRFIAVVDEFLEPLLYSRDRQITVTGRVQGVHTRKIGDFPYQYPLVAVDFHHLWPKRIKPVQPDYPYLWPYYPWYYPPHYPRYPYQLVPHHR